MVDLEKLELLLKHHDSVTLLTIEPQEWFGLKDDILAQLPALITELRETRAALEVHPISDAPIAVPILVKHKHLGWVEAEAYSDMLMSINPHEREFPWSSPVSDNWLYTRDLLAWMPLPAVPELAKALEVEE